MKYVWMDSEGALRSREIESVPGVRCTVCSTGMLRIEGNGLSSSGVYHPADRGCITALAPVGILPT